MIKVTIDDNKLTIKGHAGYSLKGKDIVCASVSSIVITTINAIIRIDKQSIEYIQDEGFIEVNILKHERVVDTLIENMVELLKELQKSYSKYIEIN